MKPQYQQVVLCTMLPGNRFQVSTFFGYIHITINLSLKYVGLGSLCFIEVRLPVLSCWSPCINGFHNKVWCWNFWPWPSYNPQIPQSIYNTNSLIIKNLIVNVIVFVTGQGLNQCLLINKVFWNSPQLLQHYYQVST